MVNDLKIKVSLSLEIGKSLSNKNCLVSTPQVFDKTCTYSESV